MTGIPDAPGDVAAPRAKVTGRRVTTGLLVAAGVVLLILLDGALGNRPRFQVSAPGTGLLLAFLAAAALREFYALLDRVGLSSHARFGAGASAALLALRALAPAFGVRTADAFTLGVAGLVLAGFLPIAAAIGYRGEEDGGAPTAEPLRRAAGTAAGLVFIHLPMALLLELRLVPAVLGMGTEIPPGLVLAAMVVVACKGGDAAAYFAGRTIGRHPLCAVSPKKTWEGAVAGVLVGTAAAGAIGAAFGLRSPEAFGLGLVANLAGQGGDLVESWVKRAAGAKDSGATLGEMGGALDLVDALLLAGPAAWAYHRIVLA